MSINVVLFGDSRTFGAADPGDFLANPDPYTSYGSGFTSNPNVSLSGGSGSGGVVAGSFNPANGQPIIAVIKRGTGYTLGNMPTINVSGGGGTPGDYAFRAAQVAGGCVIPLENYLHANSYSAVNVLNAGLDGEKVSAYSTAGMASQAIYRLLAAELSAQNRASSIICIDEGINDAINSIAASVYHDDLLNIVSRFVSDGYNVVIDKPYGVGPNYPSASTVNATLQSYFAQIDAIVAAFPTQVFAGADLYAPMQPHPEYLSPADSLHPIAAGDAFIAGIKGAAYRAVLEQLFPASPALSVSLSLDGNNHTVASWQPVSGAGGYHVLRSADEVTWNRIAEVGSTSTTYTDANEPSGTNFYAVIAH